MASIPNAYKIGQEIGPLSNAVAEPGYVSSRTAKVGDEQGNRGIVPLGIVSCQAESAPAIRSKRDAE